MIKPNLLIDDYIKNINEWKNERWDRSTSYLTNGYNRRIKTVGF